MTGIKKALIVLFVLMVILTMTVPFTLLTATRP